MVLAQRGEGGGSSEGLIGVQRLHCVLFSGELDDIPEVAFYMVGSIEDVLAAAEKLAQQQQ